MLKIKFYIFEKTKSMIFSFVSVSLQGGQYIQVSLVRKISFRKQIYVHKYEIEANSLALAGIVTIHVHCLISPPLKHRDLNKMAAILQG